MSILKRTVISLIAAVFFGIVLGLLLNFTSTCWLTPPDAQTSCAGYSAIGSSMSYLLSWPMFVVMPITGNIFTPKSTSFGPEIWTVLIISLLSLWLYYYALLSLVLYLKDLRKKK